MAVKQPNSKHSSLIAHVDNGSVLLGNAAPPESQIGVSDQNPG